MRPGPGLPGPGPRTPGPRAGWAWWTGQVAGLIDPAARRNPERRGQLYPGRVVRPGPGRRSLLGRQGRVGRRRRACRPGWWMRCAPSSGGRRRGPAGRPPHPAPRPVPGHHPAPTCRAGAAPGGDLSSPCWQWGRRWGGSVAPGPVPCARVPEGLWCTVALARRDPDLRPGTSGPPASGAGRSWRLLSTPVQELTPRNVTKGASEVSRRGRRSRLASHKMT